MKNYLLLLFSFLITNFLLAQNSNKCQQDFKWLSNYIEKNLPAYQNDVTESNKANYFEFKNEMQNEAARSTSIKSCFKPLAKYTEYFFDNHTRLVTNGSIQVDENSKESIQEFKNSNVYKSVERVTINVDSMKNKYGSYPKSEVEGVYISNGSAYEVALIRDVNGNRDYIGVILSSTSSLWEPGMVKFELTKNNQNTFDAFYYYRNHSVVHNSNEVFNDGTLSEGWFKTETLVETSKSKKKVNQTPNTLFHFEQVNDDTNYVYLRSFDGKLKPRYDSLYASIKPKIKALPNLIIDVRHNGGGSDTNIEFLRNLMFTKPYEGGRQQIWNSYDVEKHYKNFLVKAKAEPDTYGKDIIDWAKFMLKLLKKGKKNSFLYTSKKKRPMKFKARSYPKKIILIQGESTGSTAENVIISGMNSDKTTTIGRNTGGYLGYGNIFDLDSPSGNFKLWASTTQNDYKMQFEAKGIPPQVHLSNDVDWVEEALKILDKE